MKFFTRDDTSVGSQHLLFPAFQKKKKINKQKYLTRTNDGCNSRFEL